MRKFWKKYDKQKNQKNQKCYFNTIPVELFQEILNHLVTDRYPKDSFKDVYSLSATCRQFNEILSSEILYETVFIKTKRQAIRLLKCLKRNPHNAQLVKTLFYCHPEDDTSATVLLSHSGYSFSSLSNESKQRPCPDIILDLLSLMTNLENLYLDEIAPGFKFPASLRDSKVVAAINDRKTALKIHLSPELGWSLTLHQDTLWAFGKVQTLHLTHYTFDHSSINTRQLVNVPNLILSGCKIRLDTHLFAKAMDTVTNLTIDNLKSIDDISAVYSLPNLNHLDLNLVGKASRREPHQKRRLYPAANLLPPAKRNEYSSPNEDNTTKQMDLSRLESVLRHIGNMRLSSLTLTLPKVCLLSESHQNYNPSFSIIEHFHLISHIPTTLQVSSTSALSISIPEEIKIKHV